MLPFFTEPYPDELMYSAIARFHFYSGNIDYKDTLEEVFQRRSVIPSVEIGSHFSMLAKRLGPNYSVENLLTNHTIYPYYAHFLSKQRQQEILGDVQKVGQGIYSRLGMVAGGICKKNGLYYCPECAANDMEQFGEPYIHREHQLQGIDYCAHHQLRLKKYKVDFSTQSRIEFIRFDAKLMDFSILHEGETEQYFDIQIQLAKMAYQLFQVELSAFSREVINQKYRSLLRELNLVTVSNHVRQVELYQAFQTKLSKDLLERYESTIDVADEYNWLKVLTRNLKRHVHPFRHLLMLYFLNQDVESFLQVNEDIGPFGKGPYPCLNKAEKHYMQNIISHVHITRDFKSNNPIGTFKCSCGFIYARKGPDRTEKDKYRIGRVKAYGEVWQSKLKELSHEGLSIRAISRELNIDSKTVRRYLATCEKLINKENTGQNSMIAQYKQQLLKGIEQHPTCSRTQIRKLLSKQYTYLYRYDQDWLYANLPVITKMVKGTQTVDWVARDKEYCMRIKKLYKELLALEKPVRITASLIGKRVGISFNLEKYLDKLTNTEQLLNKITESVQQFQIRRCCKIIDRMLREDEPVLLWKVQRIGAIKSHHFHKIKPKLLTYLQLKRKADYDGADDQLD